MTQYKLQINPVTNEICAITIVGKNISIPLNEANTDYIAYLAWLDEGNEPEAAD